MSSLVNYISDLGSDIKHKLVDMTGVQPHNICDPYVWTSITSSPDVPLCMAFPDDKLEVGTLITITGYLTSSFSKRFRIDFITGSCEHKRLQDQNPVDRSNQYNIAFHFNPRISGGNEQEGHCDIVVMNSRIDGQWGEEVRNSRFPFKMSAPFKMMILVKEECFNIAVDDQHCYEFKHRENFQKIGRMHIEGNIVIGQIEIRKELSYMRRNNSSSSSSSSSSSDIERPPPQPTVKLLSSPAVPLSEFDARLSKPCNIYMAGTLPNYIDSNFVINLACSNPPEKRNIPVHISIRADQKTVVRNTMTEGNYGEEELALESDFAFAPGTHFDLMLCNKVDKLALIVNGQLAFEFTHRLDARSIDTLEVNGSAQLTSVRLEFLPEN